MSEIKLILSGSCMDRDDMRKFLRISDLSVSDGKAYGLPTGNAGLIVIVWVICADGCHGA